MKRTHFALVLLLMLCACAPSVPSFIALAPAAKTSMSVAECRAAEICTIRGKVSVIESDGIAMGEIRQGDGQCLTLSLSQNDIRYLRMTGPIEAMISGKIYRGHHDPNYILLKIEGRNVGYPRCGEFYLFVPSST